MARLRTRNNILHDFHEESFPKFHTEEKVNFEVLNSQRLLKTVKDQNITKVNNRKIT